MSGVQILVAGTRTWSTPPKSGGDHCNRMSFHNCKTVQKKSLLCAFQVRLCTNACPLHKDTRNKTKADFPTDRSFDFVLIWHHAELGWSRKEAKNVLRGCIYICGASWTWQCGWKQNENGQTVPASFITPFTLHLYILIPARKNCTVSGRFHFEGEKCLMKTKEKQV